MAVRALFFHRDLPYHGGVPQLFLNLARNRDQSRLTMFVAAFGDSTEGLKADLESLGVPILSMTPGFLEAAAKLRSFIQDQAIHVVVCTCFRAYIVAKLATVTLETPVVFWVHSIPLVIDGRFRTAVYRILAARDTIVYVSEAVRSAHYFPRHQGRDVVIYNGVVDPLSCDRYAPYPREERRSLGIDESAAIIGYTADFVEWKNHKRLIEAFRLVTDRVRRAHLLLIGTGDAKASAEQLAKQLGLSSSVHFLGPRSDARRLLGLIDVYVHPSLGEGFGLSLVEAMLANVPVVGANMGAIPEFVLDGETGWLCDPLDPIDIARKILEVFSHPVRSHCLAESGREYCLKCFAPEEFAVRLTGVLEAVVADK